MRRPDFGDARRFRPGRRGITTRLIKWRLRMNRKTKTGFISAMILALLLSTSCANIHNDRTRTQTEGALAGAGIGAAVGAIIGAATGNSRSAAVGAAIGAGVGAMGGLAYGTHVANKKADYASEEAWLAACLSQARSANQQAAAYNQRLKNTLAQYKGSGKTAVKPKGYSFDSSPAKGGSKNQGLQKDLKEGQKALAALNNEISNQEKALASAGKSAQSKQLSQEIKTMKQQKQQLEQTTRDLAAISSRLSV